MYRACVDKTAMFFVGSDEKPTRTSTLTPVNTESRAKDSFINYPTQCTWYRLNDLLLFGGVPLLP